MTLPDRNEVFWWVYVLALGGAALYIAHSFVGILVLGLFGYYATRPICTRIDREVESNQLAAALTVLTVLIPVLVLTAYAGIRTFQQIQARMEGSVLSVFLSRVVGLDVEGEGLGALVRDPPSLDRLSDLALGSAVEQGLVVLDALFGTMLLLGLAVTLSYALLVYDGALSTAFARLVEGEDSTVYSYALAVDSDLESVFFGNLLFVMVMALIATATYTLTNLVLPGDMNVPMAFTLGVLTGIASLIPIVVGKVVYIPVVAYLAFTTARDGGGARFLIVGGVLVVYVLVLDVLPQSFLQPVISGRQMNSMVLLFAYVLGPILFGWYGFFLLPIVFVLMLETARVVLPELLHGDPVEPEPGIAEDTGADAGEMQDDDPDVSPSSEN